MKVRMEAQPNPRLRSMSDAVRLDPADMAELLTIVDSRFGTNMRRQFATEGASGGDRWPPLSPDYAKWKAKRYPGRKIMTRTGRLRRSLANINSSGHVKRWALKPRATLTMGTRVDYAAFHIPGPLKNPRLPVRDTLQHTQAQMRRYTALIIEYLKDVKLDRMKRALAAARPALRLRRRGGQ